MAKSPVQAKKQRAIDIKKIVSIIVITLVVLKISKDFFFIAFFTVLAYLGKEFRGRSGLKMVVLDPLLFSAIMTAKFLGLKEAILLIAINTIIVDFLTFLASIGTFLNFMLYSIGVIVGIGLFGNSGMQVYGNVASFMYSALYIVFRTSLFIPSPFASDPFQTIVKGITSMIFTFLYLIFLGPLFRILMTAGG